MDLLIELYNFKIIYITVSSFRMKEKGANGTNRNKMNDKIQSVRRQSALSKTNRLNSLKKKILKKQKLKTVARPKQYRILDWLRISTNKEPMRYAISLSFSTIFGIRFFFREFNSFVSDGSDCPLTVEPTDVFRVNLFYYSFYFKLFH